MTAPKNIDSKPEKVALGALVTVKITQGIMECWKCKRETPILLWVLVMVGEHGQEFTIPQIGEYPGFFEEVSKHIPSGVNFSAIKPRYSKTQERTYLSNGCIHCDAIVGEFYEHHAWDTRSDVCTFMIEINEIWHRALNRSDA